jgi:hypothetical protein
MRVILASSVRVSDWLQANSRNEAEHIEASTLNKGIADYFDKYINNSSE